MHPNELDLSTIDPKVHPKYSPNLHAFLSARKMPITARYAGLHRDEHGVLWLGYWFDGEFTGARLHHVLCYGRKAQVYTYIRMDALTEIPDFWQKYRELGRCAIDPEHKISFIGEDSRWVSAGEGRRSCAWCGKGHQHQVRTTEVVERTSWQSAPEPALAEA